MNISNINLNIAGGYVCLYLYFVTFITDLIYVLYSPHAGIAQKVFSTGEPLKDNAKSYPLMVEFTVDAMVAPLLFEDTRYVPYEASYAHNWSWVSPYWRLERDGYSVMKLTKDIAAIEYWTNEDVQVNTTYSILDATFCILDGVVEFVYCPSTRNTPEGDGRHKTYSVITCASFVALFSLSLFSSRC